jgi:hypothetical protein
MDDEPFDVIEHIDPPSALAISEGLTFRYAVFIANVRSKILGALVILIALLGAASAAVLPYFLPSEAKLSAAAWPFIPSLLVILAFATAATVRYILNLNAVSSAARAALRLQLDAQECARTAWAQERKT